MNLLGLKGLISSEPRKALADNTGSHNLSGSAANRNEEVRVTLWGDCARTFDIEVVTQQPSPIVAVFTSLKVKRFLGNRVLSSTGCTLFFINPKIPEAANYKLIGYNEETYAFEETDDENVANTNKTPSE
ncbi:unnamed protein product [Malus baccata var. baccata]